MDADTVHHRRGRAGRKSVASVRIQERLKEASHMGFKKAVIPKRNQELNLPMEILGVERVEEAIRAVII